MQTQYIAVTQLLSKYFDALYFSDAQRLSEIFHPDAHYVCVTDGSLQRLTMDQYFPIVSKRPSPASTNQQRKDNIISLEFAGPVTAYARVECIIGHKFFTDFLTLICINGQWQIISKVFHYELKPEASSENTTHNTQQGEQPCPTSILK